MLSDVILALDISGFIAIQIISDFLVFIVTCQPFILAGLQESAKHLMAVALR